MADRTEEEQIEAIKRWWDENGKSLIVGIVVALGGVFGYQAWQDHVRETGEAASSLYEDLVAAVTRDSPFETIEEEQLKTGKFIATQLEETYPDSTYAHFAALFMAKVAVEAGDLDTAEKELNWALEHGIDESLEAMTRIRLARVKIARGEPEAALAMLESIDPGTHSVSFEEVRGDAYMALNDEARAREAYGRAVEAQEEGRARPMLQMKLDDLVVAENVIPENVIPETGETGPTQAESQDEDE